MIGETILLAGSVVYGVLLVVQLVRICLCPNALVDEWRSSAQFVFFSAATISGSLLAAAVLPYSTTLAKFIWWPTTSAQLVLLVASMRRWMTTTHPVTEANPTWLIPMVGNASPAFAGVALGYEDLSRAMLMSAIACWIAFQPIILFRLCFAEPRIAVRALPGLKILVSAPAVIAIALSTILGHGNLLTEFGTYCSLFFALCVASHGKRLWEARFSRSWWGFTFPMAALSSALIRLYQVRPGAFTATLAVGCLSVATAIVTIVVFAALRHGLTSTGDNHGADGHARPAADL
ncbi:C4-dicarboxylate transporter [Agrobacterium tumefaciens]|uniref:SLAC1 family transporter n=1 Tax=Agrobacterium tumefaciens TaxID=358 RepID=UPI001572503D|nr:C4-dicarboxylate transporter [Agrobacterium tumefaciens]